MTEEIRKAAESCYIKNRYRSLLEAHVIGFGIGYSLSEKELAEKDRVISEQKLALNEADKRIEHSLKKTFLNNGYMNNNITEDYCSFEVSKLLKEKEFDVKMKKWWIEELPHTIEPYYYRDSEHEMTGHEPMILHKEVHNCEHHIHHCPAPTHALAIKWIRENFGIHIWARKSNNSDKWFWRLDGSESDWKIPDKRYNSPEEATEAALKYCLENLV